MCKHIYVYWSNKADEVCVNGHNWQVNRQLQDTPTGSGFIGLKD